MGDVTPANVEATPEELRDAIYACRFYAPTLRSKALSLAADMLETLAAENATLRARVVEAEAEAHSTGHEREVWKTKAEASQADTAALRAAMERMRDALAWYAGDGSNVYQIDGGQRARAALTGGAA